MFANPLANSENGCETNLDALFECACQLAVDYRRSAAANSPYPHASLETLRGSFGKPLANKGMDPNAVIQALAAAARPGLVGSTGARFHGWIIGASHPVGVAAEWLGAAWGQNAGLYESSPAAAVAEEKAGQLLLELLRLPKESSIGFVTGATMAGFTCLAAARWRQFALHGVDLDHLGLSGAPPIRIFLGQEAHSTIYHALRMLGFGERDLVRVPSDEQGRMILTQLEAAMCDWEGPAIVIAQAGHINSGAFDDFGGIAKLARKRGAWLHIDGAFGLWAQACPELQFRTQFVDLADSWSVDGHKILQVPYDSGYAIVRDRVAHSHAMRIDASYLPTTDDAHDPSHYVPELSRRARGFATWAVIHALGRDGIAQLVLGQHRAAARLADAISKMPSYELMNEVAFNQVAVALRHGHGMPTIDDIAQSLADNGRFFVKAAHWNERDILRISISGPVPCQDQLNELLDQLEQAMMESNHRHDESRGLAAIWL